MKEKKERKDRTVTELFDLLSGFVSFTKDQFEKMERRFDKNDKLFEILGQEVVRVNKEVKDVKTTVGHIEQDVLSMKEDVDALAKTMARDSMTTRSHERRITRLERSR